MSFSRNSHDGGVAVGFTLSSEEFPASQLVEHARAIENAGFDFAMISDHFHPWTSEQGESPFVWSVLGAIARATDSLEVGTGVTCPTMRVHPAIVAQAAATCAGLFEGRFMLGVGSGERLNEHVTGERWPEVGERQEMLAEAIDVIRELWRGGEVTWRGRHYAVERARLHSLPDTPPMLLVAAGGLEAARLAGEVGDGLIAVAPASELVEKFLAGESDSRPRIGQVQVCWAEDKESAEATALKNWPNAALGGNLSQELETPADFEAATELVRPDDLKPSVTASDDPDDFIAAIADYREAGFTHVYLHQIGPAQHEAIEFFAEHVLPAARRLPAPLDVSA